MNRFAYLATGCSVCLGDVLGAVFGVAGAELGQVTLRDDFATHCTRGLGLTLLSGGNTLCDTRLSFH